MLVQPNPLIVEEIRVNRLPLRERNGEEAGSVDLLVEQHRVLVRVHEKRVDAHAVGCSYRLDLLLIAADDQIDSLSVLGLCTDSSRRTYSNHVEIEDVE